MLCRYIQDSLRKNKADPGRAHGADWRGGLSLLCFPDKAQKRMSADEQRYPARLVSWLARGFHYAEDVVYIGLGIVLATAAFALLITELLHLGDYVFTGTLSENIILLLDRILLIVIFVEVLYTVQVSFLERVLRPEPFLVVGLIAVTRRVLVVTAELPHLAKADEIAFRNAMIELALLTVLLVSLVFSLRMLRRSESGSAARRG